MSNYRITGYQDGYAEHQAILDIEVSKTWLMPDGTPVKKLAEHYRSLDVDPDLRLYCFKGEEMIGFTSNTLIESEDGSKHGKMVYPVVLPGNEETVELLTERSIEGFLKKGVDLIKSTVGLWGGSAEWANRWGFSEKSEIGVLYGLDVDSFIVEEQGNVEDFNIETDIEPVVSIFSAAYNLPEEGIRAFTERLYVNNDTLGYYVVRGKDELLATGAISVNRNVPSLGSLSAVYDRGVPYLKSLLGRMILTAKENRVERIHMFFTHLSPGHPLIEKFTSLGFRYLGSNVNYEKSI